MAEKRKFQAIKGTRDLLPPETELWNRIEQTAREVFGTFGFGEVRLPIFEPTELFARSIGVETDTVVKEMFTFLDPFDPLELARRFKESQLDTFGDSGAGFPDVSTVERAKASFYQALLRTLPDQKRVAGQIGRYGDLSQAPLETRTDSQEPGQGQFLSLRPEATASVCRAFIEHGMHALPQPVKLYYYGPMFRRERPQKGRYRQFYQIGA